MRVDHVSDLTGEKLVKFCNKYYDEYLIIYEDKDGNEHYHVHGFTTCTMGTVRQQFRRMFPENSGNKGYELKECDDDVNAYLRYLAKGDSPDDMPVLIDYKGYEYDLDSLHEQFWAEFNDRNGTYDADFKKRKRLNNDELVKQAMQLVKDKMIDARDKPRIYLCLREVFKSHDRILNLYRARDYVYEIMHSLSTPEDDFLLAVYVTEKW